MTDQLAMAILRGLEQNNALLSQLLNQQVSSAKQFPLGQSKIKSSTKNQNREIARQLVIEQLPGIDAFIH